MSLNNHPFLYFIRTLITPKLVDNSTHRLRFYRFAGGNYDSIDDDWEKEKQLIAVRLVEH